MLNSSAKENSLTSSLELKFVDESEFDQATSQLKKQVFRECLAVANHLLYSEQELHQSEANTARFAKLEAIYCLLMLNGKCIGWHYGHQDGPTSYYMCNSAVLPEYRRQGCYSWLAQKVMEEVTRRGYLRIKSRHYPTNNPVIIAKLKLGFVVTGLQLSANFGTLLELEWHVNQGMTDLMKFRCGETLPSESALKSLGLTRS
ncbi:MAG: GNAT family N-acetyltransferase [Silvanigrellaceae bacterium]